MNLNRPQSIIPSQGGVIRELIVRVKLVMQLIGDRRVNPWLKLIPVAALIYWISPVDLIMGIPGLDAVDDIAVLWFAQYLFIEMCPADVVQELTLKLTNNNTYVESKLNNQDEEIVDGEAHDIS